MIIDNILDRKDGFTFDREEFIENCMVEGFEKIAAAFFINDERAAKCELCDYIINQGYAANICGYIWSTNWTLGGMSMSEAKLKLELVDYLHNIDPYSCGKEEILEAVIASRLEDNIDGLSDTLDELKENEADAGEIMEGRILLAAIKYMANRS